jgi:hypothetical protein
MPFMSQELVLTFHGIGPPPAYLSEDERSYWISENDFAAFVARAVNQAQELDITLVASFDDGNRSDKATPDLRDLFPLCWPDREPGLFGG